MKITLKICALLLALCMLFPTALFVAFADSPMAYNLYIAPDVSKTRKIFSTFMIDMKADQTPYYTYWSLCNFNLYLSAQSKRAYPGLSGGGAYAGLQNRAPYQGKAAILSFWEMSTNAGIMNAQRIYPDGESTFTGEGDGTNCIRSYQWQTGSWYRMLLHAWEDEEAGRTFVGQWFYDYDRDEWMLLSYFNTQLIASALEGGMSFFLENYWYDTYNETRDVYLRNAYVIEYKRKDWVPLTAATLTYGDGGRANKVGIHEIETKDGCFWGLAGGDIDTTVYENQAAYNRASLNNIRREIEIASEPTLGKPGIAALELRQGAGGLTVSWSAASGSTPQLSYTLEVYNEQGEKVASKTQTRPEITETTFPELTGGEYNCKLTINDVFGEKTTATAQTAGYGTQTPEKLVKELPFAVGALIGKVAATKKNA